MTEPLVTLEDLRGFFKQKGLPTAGRTLRQLQTLYMLGIKPELFIKVFCEDRGSNFPGGKTYVSACSNIDPKTWSKVVYDLRETIQSLPEEKIECSEQLLPGMPRWMAVGIYLCMCHAEPLKFAVAMKSAESGSEYKTSLRQRQNLAKFKISDNMEEHEALFRALYFAMKK